ncbi:MAG: helix-turn-helix transcriptional regulator [Synergistaceae bacterium]|nr:helix-turn-helix transcriptional regulator [Synergistaceae bacterium]
MQRKECRLTQEELAAKINVSVMSIRRWEWGNTEPRAEELQKLATALDTTSAYLLGESDDPRPVKSADKAEPVQPEINFEPVNKDDMARETSIDKGTLIYTFGDKKLEVPNTPENAAMFWEIVKSLIAQ